MTDFSDRISNPKLMTIGAAAQLGIFGAYVVSLAFGFTAAEAGAIGIIGGADGPTAIFVTSAYDAQALWGLCVKVFSNVLVIVLNYVFSKLIIFKNRK